MRIFFRHVTTLIPKKMAKLVYEDTSCINSYGWSIYQYKTEANQDKYECIQSGKTENPDQAMGELLQHAVEHFYT